VVAQFFCVLAFERIRSGRSVCCLVTKGSGEKFAGVVQNSFNKRLRY
jgi:hypothetical protein